MGSSVDTLFQFKCDYESVHDLILSDLLAYFPSPSEQETESGWTFGTVNSL